MRTLALIAGLLFLIVIWCCVAPRNASRSAGPAEVPPMAARVLQKIEALEQTRAGRPRAEAPPANADVTATELDEAALIRLLRAAAQAWSKGDTQALTEPLETLLSSPRTPRRVLAMLEHGNLTNGSREQQGAVLAIGFGLAHASRTGALAFEGRPLALDVLESLTRIARDPGVSLAQFASSLRAGTQLAVGVKWIATIVSLRERVPTHAENFDPLLRVILDDSEPLDVPADDLPALSLVVSTSNDPLAVETALAALVASDPGLFIPVAEDLRAHSAGNEALRAAAVGAIAARAPVDMATQSLARIADGELYAQFARLGSRAGGMEAVQREYNALIAGSSRPEARKMLVSAMAAEDPAVLVGIAQTDPDPEVRHQALLTASIRPLVGDDVMQTVRDQHDMRAASGGSSTNAGLMVAENVAINGTGSARASAVAWLRQVAGDPRESLVDRLDAWSKLREHASPGEFAGIDEPR